MYSSQRESSAAITSKYGFSVVAPIKTTSSFLHRVEECILLGLGETMDLVDEEHGSPARLPKAAARLVQHTPNVRHTRIHGGQLREGCIEMIGNQFRHRGLA